MVFLCRGSYHLQTIRNSSFPIWIPFISLFSLIAVAKASRNMLNSSGESGHPFLVPDCRGNVFSFSPLRIMFAVVLSFVAFMMLCPFSACFLVCHKWVLNFVKAFICINWDNNMAFIFQLINMVFHVDWFMDIEESFHPCGKAHLVMMCDLFNMLLDFVC